MGFYSAEDVLGIDDIETEEVSISGWQIEGKPVKFLLRVLTMDEVLGQQTNVDDPTVAAKALVQMSVVQPAFTMEQVNSLFRKRATAVSELIKKINKLNKFNQSEEETAANADEFLGEHAQIQPVLAINGVGDAGAKTAKRANAS